jgi:hypothetical protein
MFSIEEFIDNVLPNQRGETFVTANKLLVQAGFEEHIERIELAFNKIGSVDTEDVIRAVEEILIQVMVDKITDHGISINSGIPLDVINDIFSILTMIQGYDSPDELLELFQAGDTPEDTFCNIISVLSCKEAFLYMEHILRVSPSLLDTVKTACIMQAEVVSNIPVLAFDNRVIRDFIKRCDASKQTPPARFIGLIEDGFKLGYSVDVYLNALFYETGVRNNAADVSDIIASHLAMGFTPEEVPLGLHKTLASYVENADVLASIIASTEKLISLIGLKQVSHETL